jgi:hypothetical protein
MSVVKQGVPLASCFAVLSLLALHNDIKVQSDSGSTSPLQVP